MNRGRPLGSEVRQNLIELLFVKGKGYGYQIHKWYIKKFPAVSQRVIYYNLKKGVEIEEFQVETIRTKGEFSWGSSSERNYFKLGKKARPTGKLK
jgi:hypothetical protein